MPRSTEAELEKRSDVIDALEVKILGLKKERFDMQALFELYHFVT